MTWIMVLMLMINTPTGPKMMAMPTMPLPDKGACELMKLRTVPSAELLDRPEVLGYVSACLPLITETEGVL